MKISHFLWLLAVSDFNFFCYVGQLDGMNENECVHAFIQSLI